MASGCSRIWACRDLPTWKAEKRQQIVHLNTTDILFMMICNICPADSSIPPWLQHHHHHCYITLKKEWAHYKEAFLGQIFYYFNRKICVDYQKTLNTMLCPGFALFTFHRLSFFTESQKHIARGRRLWQVSGQVLLFPLLTTFNPLTGSLIPKALHLIPFLNITFPFSKITSLFIITFPF